MHLVGVPAIVPGVIAFVVALCVAHAGYLWIEKPLSEWLRSSWRAARTFRRIGAGHTILN